MCPYLSYTRLTLEPRTGTYHARLFLRMSSTQPDAILIRQASQLGCRLSRSTGATLYLRPDIRRIGSVCCGLPSKPYSTLRGLLALWCEASQHSNGMLLGFIDRFWLRITFASPPPPEVFVSCRHSYTYAIRVISCSPLTTFRRTVLAPLIRQHGFKTPSSDASGAQLHLWFKEEKA
jgi:hypothetical protein